MSRLFIYDENMTDERAKITVAKMAAISDIVAPEKEYIQYSARSRHNYGRVRHCGRGKRSI